MITLTLLVISSAVNAFIYNGVLIKDGHILYHFHRWLTELLTKRWTEELPDQCPAEVKAMPGYIHKPVLHHKSKKHWILKPLGDCPLCMAGQFSLWGFLFITFLPSLFPAGYLVARTAWLVITMICSSILLVMILQKLTDSAKN